jgi:hypothetical protein
MVSPQLDLSFFPEFAAKAGRVLDPYARQWNGKALKDDEFVISADEQTSTRLADENTPRTLAATHSDARGA